MRTTGRDRWKGWARGAPQVGALVLAGAFAAAPATAQTLPTSTDLSEDGPTQRSGPIELTGTLKKARDTGHLTLGFRESSVPFSYLSPRGEPIGYSVDLCRLLVDAIGDQVGRGIAVQWQAVSAASRLGAVQSGAVDLECGSTTNNLERQKLVSFSPTIFVSGTKLMVKKGSPIKSFRDLAGKTVVVTAGTTNEKALRDLIQKFRLDTTLRVAPDHAASFALLTAGEVDAFATDDVLLYGLLAQNQGQRDYVVTGEFLSYDPYGIVYRKGDPQLAALISDTFHRLAEDRELERRYQRWFLRRLPSGVSLDLPMSPQLETIIQTMVAGTE